VCKQLLLPAYISNIAKLNAVFSSQPYFFSIFLEKVRQALSDKGLHRYFFLKHLSIPPSCLSVTAMSDKCIADIKIKAIKMPVTGHDGSL